jgi:exopolyphosphatase/guanosine-5'-triphosphate,3'-diphosphate pyrophosphatase
LAAIDIGTNSVHLVIADVTRDGSIKVVDRMKEMVRLGHGAFRTGRLGASQTALAVRTLSSFRRLATTRGVERLRAVATSAVREARNGAAFVARLRREAGIPVEVISGAEEAHLIYRAVQHATVLDDGAHLLVDMGGGSIELTLVQDGKPGWYRSLPAGVARLSERFVAHDPPTAREQRVLTAHAEDVMRESLERVRRVGVVRAIGTSGSISTLISMARAAGGAEPARLEGASATRRELTRLRRLLTSTPAAARLALPGVDAKRNDLLPASAILIDTICRLGRVREVRLCTWALREGILLELAGVPTTRTARAPSARHRSVAALTKRYAGRNQHGVQVARLALALFDGVAGELALSDHARELLEHAALLHDNGHAISHDRHHRHTAYLVRNSELLGFEPLEIEVLALVARAHRKQVPKPSSPELLGLPERTRHEVRALAAILRVADALDRTHFGVVRSLRAHVGADRVVIDVDPSRHSAELELWAGRRRTESLARVVGRPVVLRVTRRTPGARR